MSKKPKKSQVKRKMQTKQSKTTTKPKKTINPPKNLSIWIAAVFFLITSSIFFWDQITGEAFFWEDFTEYVYPTQSYAASEFADGNIPFWNPYTFSGMPFLADLQVGFFYPFNRVLSFFTEPDGKLPVAALQLMIIFHFFIAQLTFYILARGWKISSLGAVIGAVSYAFSLIMVCHVIHPMIVYHLAWFPLVVHFFYKGIVRQSIKFASLAGLFLGISMLSGHPQMTLYEAFFLGVMFIWYLIAGIKNKELGGGGIVKLVIASILPVLIGAGIFCIQYLPSQELADRSQRAEMTYEKASEGSLEVKQLYTAIVPKVFGFVNGSQEQSAPFYLTYEDPAANREQRAPYYYYWETAFYVGLAALILGILGAVMKIRTRQGAFLTFAAVFGIFFALGANSFIFPIFHNLPFFDQFRNPARMIFYTVFALSIFAGFGFDSLWQGGRNLMMKFLIITGIFLLLAFLAASGAVLSGFGTPGQITSEIQSFGAASLIFMILIAIVVILTIRGIFQPFVSGVILIILAIFDLNFAGGDFNDSPKNPEESYKIDQQLKSTLKPNPPEEIFRVNMRTYKPRYMAMQRNLGLIDRIMLVEGYNPLILERVQPPLNSRGEVNALNNVRYEIMVDRRSGGARFRERQNYRPRAWMCYNAKVVPADRTENFMRNNAVDYSRTVLLEEQPEVNLSASVSTIANLKVECEEYSANEMIYEVETDKAGILCFSEVYYPAWKAYIDGEKTKIHRSNYSQRAVEVPAGKHTVKMKYQSAAYSTGKWITIISIIVAVGLFAVFRKDGGEADREDDLPR